MSTTEPIIIPIEGDPSDFVKDSAKVNAELDKMAKGTKAASGANTGMASSAKAASFSITDLRSSYMLAMEAARVAGQVWQATGQEFVNYAEQVKNMSRSLGASAEETSRLIQVADDVRVSYDTLKIAMKEAQKDGIDPNIEGLAKLADQYVKLQSPTEKTKFLLDKFGKSGMEMGKLMEKGGAGIKKMAGAIDDSLIMTKEGIKAADDYQAALDNMNDSAMAFQISLGKMAIGPVTNAMDNMVESLKVWKSNAEQASIAWERFSSVNPKVAEGLEKTEKFLREMSPAFIIYDTIFGKHTDSIEESTDALNENTPAIDQNSNALEEQKEAVEDAKNALKNYEDMLSDISQTQTDIEGMSRQYAEDQRQYEEDHKNAIEERTKAEQDLLELEATWRDAGEANRRLTEEVTFAQHDLNDAIAKYGTNSDEAAKARNKLDDAMSAQAEGGAKPLQEATEALAEAQGAVTDLEVEWHKAAQNMIYDMILTKLAVDGFTESERKAADEYAISKGIKTQADVDETNRRIDEANSVVAGIEASEDVMVENKRIAEEKKRLETAISTEEAIAASEQQAASMGIVKESVDSATQSYQAMAQAAWDAAAAAQSAAGSSSSSGSSGGSSPDERDGSSVSSSSVSKNSTFNISIHNPRGENSASSVRRALKLTSYLGHPI